MMIGKASVKRRWNKRAKGEQNSITYTKHIHIKVRNLSLLWSIGALLMSLFPTFEANSLLKHPPPPTKPILYFCVTIKVETYSIPPPLTLITRYQNLLSHGRKPKLSVSTSKPTTPSPP